MKNLELKINPDVKSVIKKYPLPVQKKINKLRKIILETAGEIPEIKSLEETLKWGEPSYLVKNGSTIRIDWKKNKPDEYAVYFKCTSRLIPTYRKFFKDKFVFGGDRSIIFQMKDKIPVAELKKCITAALLYHKVKHLPDLGLI